VLRSRIARALVACATVLLAAGTSLAVNAAPATAAPYCPMGAIGGSDGQCYSVPTGAYMPYGGYTYAFSCPMPYSTPAIGATSLQQCNTGSSAGYYATQELYDGSGIFTPFLRVVFKPCAPGTYNPYFGATSCIDAPAGWYIDVSGATSVNAGRLCPAGTFSTGGAAACTNVAPGYENSGPTGQVACPPGSWSPGAQPSCNLAPAGSYVPGSGYAISLPCAPGSFTATAGSTSCTPADVDHYVPGAGATAELPCPAGTTQPATGATACVTVKQEQTITFDPLTDQFVGATLTLHATATSGLPVSLTSLTPSVCSVTDASLTVDAAGECSVQAEQAGDDSWNAAPAKVQSLQATVATKPTITSADHVTFPVGAAGAFTVTTAPGSAGVRSITVSGALPTGVTFVDKGDGTASLSGTPSPGTGGHYPVTINASNGVTPDASQSFTLTVTAVPSITSANAAAFPTGSATTFIVTTDPGFPVATSLSVSGALPANVTFHDNGDGTATISGTPTSGNAGSYPVSIVASNASGFTTQAFTLAVGRIPQRITSFSPASQAVVGQVAALDATTSSGLVPLFSSLTGSVCSVTRGGSITFRAVGVCSVAVDQPGDGTYLPATRASGSIVVTNAFLGFRGPQPKTKVSRARPEIPVTFTVGNLSGSVKSWSAIVQVQLRTGADGTGSLVGSPAACWYSPLAGAHRCTLQTPRNLRTDGTAYYLTAYQWVPGSGRWFVVPNGTGVVNANSAVIYVK
jgi:hypothetical protein